MTGSCVTRSSAHTTWNRIGILINESCTVMVIMTVVITQLLDTMTQRTAKLNCRNKDGRKKYVIEM